MISFLPEEGLQSLTTHDLLVNYKHRNIPFVIENLSLNCPLEKLSWDKIAFVKKLAKNL